MPDTNDIIFVNYILDNVHGFIGLTATEDQIERLPIFKRLQDISQLGLVKRIFPGALHNRYIHSLGVMHVIDKMALHIGHFSPAERQLLRLAGMLHDLGHYPLSHDLEQVYDDSHTVTQQEFPAVKEIFKKDAQKTLNKIMENDSLTNNDSDDIKPKRQLVAKGQYHHETVTSRVIRSSNSIKNILIQSIKQGVFNSSMSIWNFDSPEEDVVIMADKIINDICALIQGNGDYDYKEGAFPEHFTAMLQLMHSELDADRIDYLLRDATFSGASYGTFDLGILLQNLTMKQRISGEWIVGIKEKGIGCADQYMVNRYLAYTQVIFHKYTSIIAKMLREVVRWMMYNDSGFDFYTPKKVNDIIRTHEKNTSYLSFTDSYFFEKLNSIDKTNHGCPDDIYFFVQQLKKYQALDVEMEDIFSGDSNQQAKHYEESILFQQLTDTSLEDNSLFLIERKGITNHLPYEKFKEKFDEYNQKHSCDLNWEKYQLDRLMDGLVVINESGEPALLIDTPRSIMTDLYGLQQTMFRKYKYPIC